MAVTIQHLNSDATFLFTFEPRSYQHSQAVPSKSPKPFRILLDPWITGPAKFIHPKLAKATHRQPPCILSLLELAEPDLIIISHHSSKHCNEATLRQLPAIGTKTIILTTTPSARKIKSWKYFEKSRVRILPKWEPPESGDPKTPNIFRFTVPSTPPGEPGEVTVTFIPQKHDLFGLRYAVGITYRPPSPQLYQLPLLPKLRSKSQSSLRSTRSAAPSPQQQQHSSPPPDDRPISILYAPHSISYSAIHSYVTSHLVSEAALPLTVLLHPFNTHHEVPFSKPRDTVPSSGVEIATKLAAKVWISAHDGDLVHRGFTSKFFTRIQRNPHSEDHIRNFLAQAENGANKTTVVDLESGEKTIIESTTSKNGTVDEREPRRNEQERQQIENNSTLDEECESCRKGASKVEEDQSQNLPKVGLSDSGKGQVQAEMLMGSWERCNWRSNLELFLKKEEGGQGGSLTKQRSLFDS
ncbi:hypothetical protein B0T21DRAFT_392722 [Apiosordaria backusii]|uniref:Uncharacterized protein n=1 Tax=Apiosordaria backusii TaxID=314023 RepID=A0AA40EF70_9PEZI|nr:hypothetical protein B0T21DRAFT_392722 [Apiosordaria backusii]